MLRALTSFLERKTSAGGGAEDREHELKLATAVLLVEVARADFAEDEAELDAVANLLGPHLGLPEDDVRELVAEARQKADHAASLQAFTRQLHEELELGEKLKIVELLWEVALADETLDRHEDHLIRKVSDLLYVSHSDLIRIRNRVLEGRRYSST